MYMCNLHNQVNERIKKPIFDCKKALSFWGGDCGCTENKDKKENHDNKNTTRDYNITSEHKNNTIRNDI